MKIQIEHYDEVHTFETSSEAMTSSDMVGHLYGLLLAVGYEKESVDEAFLEKAEEIEPMPTKEPQKDKERLDWLQSSDLTLHSWDEGDVWARAGVYTIREYIDKQMEEAQ